MAPLLRSVWRRAPVALARRAPVALAFAVLVGLSLPGIQVRAADDGIAPKASDLLRLNPQAAEEPAPAGDACAPADPAVQAQQIAAQREAMRRLAEQMAAAEASGDFKVLDGRGVGYHMDPNPALDLMRVRIEAERQAQAPAPAPAPAQP